jgi:hypothetical protein
VADPGSYRDNRSDTPGMHSDIPGQNKTGFYRSLVLSLSITHFLKIKMEKHANHETNLDRIKAQLLAGNRITLKSVWDTIRTTELRHYVSVLRKTSKLDISSEWVSDHQGHRYKEYFIKSLAP